MFKREVSFEGMDCLADEMLSKYSHAKIQSQAEVPWTYQPVYGKYTVYFGVVVIFIAFVKHLCFLCIDRRTLKNQNSKGTGFLGSLFYTLISYSRYIAYQQVPAKVSYFTSLPPSVGSSLFMVVSSLYLFCYCLVPHYWYRGCSGFGSPPLAVRAGIMATALTPFIYVLSGKSNMISLLTGISYEKLNSTHQYVGVAAFILSIIHTIPFIYQPLQEGGTAALKAACNDSTYYMSGIPPLVLLAWLCMASKKWVRDRCYEAFLHLHWLCGIAYFGTLIWHINKSLDMQDYMWGALAFWATQLIYRMLVKTTFKPNSLFLRSRKGDLQKLDHNSYQITIENIKGLKWKPGQHCYLRFIGTRMLDNHPFSICSIENDEHLRFIIVPRKGLTSQLYQELDQYTATSKKVYIDGPYGGTARNIESFDKVMLLATGSGVSATLPFLQTLAERINDGIVTSQIDFVWIVRDASNINWIKDQLKRCTDIAKDSVKVDIYVTHGSNVEKTTIDAKNNLSNDQLEKSMEISSEISDFSNINVHYFKPDVKIIMRELYPTLKRRNMIVSSGSGSMKSTVSQFASSFQTKIFNSDLRNEYVEEVYLHTESFGW